MKVLMLLKSSLDYDSRVKKEIASLAAAGFKISLVSVNGSLDSSLETHNILYYQAKRRFLPGVSSFLSQFLFMRSAVNAYKKHDIIHSHELNTLFAGVMLKIIKNRKIKLLYDSHEYAPNDVPNEGKLSITVKHLFEKALIHFADSVIVVSDSIANEYSRLYGIPKPHLVLNCPAYHEQPKRNLFRKRLGIRADQTIFLYQGGLSKGRGIELLLEAFSDLNTDKNVLVCMGYGPLEGLIQEKAQQQSTVFFHPAVSPDVLLNYTSSADYGVSFIEDSCLSYRYCLPNKMFEYLMAGLPVLTSNLYEMKRLVETEGIGIVAEENTVEGFRKAVEASLIQDYDAIQKNVFAARRKYCWENQEVRLVDTYHKLHNP